MSGHTPLTPAEIARREAIILPMIAQHAKQAYIAEVTGFTRGQIGSVVYRARIVAYRARRTNPDILKAHSLADVDAAPVMVDTGKKCCRCKRMIQKNESYHNVSRGWEHLEPDCRKRKTG
jgi:hypothetical protein